MEEERAERVEGGLAEGEGVGEVSVAKRALVWVPKRGLGVAGRVVIVVVVVVGMRAEEGTFDAALRIGAPAAPA